MEEMWIDEYNGKAYTIISQIGEGGNGCAYLLQNGKRFYVLKQIKNCGENGKIKEAKYMEKYKSGTSVKVYDYKGGLKEYEGKKCILMDYVPGTSLHNFLEIYRNAGVNLPRLNKYIIIYGIAKAIYNLHTFYNVRHRDIKPENIFIDQDLHPHLGDFGDISTHTHTFNDHGTNEFIPPEAFKDDNSSIKCRAPFDVWCFGSTLFQILTLEFPFSNIEEADRYKYIQEQKKDRRVENGELKIKKSDRELYEVVKFCWEDDPEDRPEMSDVMWIVDKDAQEKLPDEEYREYCKYKERIDKMEPDICGTEENFLKAISMGFANMNPELRMYAEKNMIRKSPPSFPAARRK